MKIIWNYLIKDKKKTFTIIISTVLMVCIMVCLGNLIYGIRNCQAEYSRSINGYYEYSFDGNLNELETFRKTNNHRYRIGVTQFIETTEIPIPLQLLGCDNGFLKMNHINLLEGKMPSNNYEVLVEEWVLYNLGTDMGIGDEITFGEKKYTISGILSDSYFKTLKEMNVFTTFMEDGKCGYYIQFNDKKALDRQMEQFAYLYKVDKAKIRANWNVLESEGIKAPIGKQNSNFLGWIKNITINEYGVTVIWGILSVFMIYSVYYLSLFKREKDYGILKSLGCSRSRLFFIVFIELFVLFLGGYVLGYFLGNVITVKLYNYFMDIFLNSYISVVDFQVNFDAIKLGFIVMVVLLLLITLFVVQGVYNSKSIDLIKRKEKKLLKKRGILSLQYTHLIYNVVYRFMTIRKTMFVLIIISLSVGNLIFLTAQYSLKQMKEQNILEIKSDMGNKSDYRLYIGNTDLVQGISIDKLKEIKEMKGIREINAFRYTLGSVVLTNKQYPNKEYFAPENDNERIKDMTGGICTEQDDGTYLLRTNIWGYDEKAIENMQDFLIDGKIDCDDITQGKKAIIRLSMSGSGKYDNVLIKPGDIIQIKIPKIDCYSKEDILKFQNDDYYNTVEMEVAATIKTVSTRNEYFIDDSGIDVIIGNNTFINLTGISDYNQVEISKAQGSDMEEIHLQLSNIINGVKSGYFIDHTFEIEQVEKNYRQRLFIFTLMAGAIVIMGFLYVANCARYFVHMWKHEIKILRAIGLSNKSLYEMMIMEALLYSLFSFLIVFIGTIACSGGIFIILRDVLFFFHAEYRIEWITMGILGVCNMVVCLCIMLLSAKVFLKAEKYLI